MCIRDRGYIFTENVTKIVDYLLVQEALCIGNQFFAQTCVISCSMLNDFYQNIKTPKRELMWCQMRQKIMHTQTTKL